MRVALVTRPKPDTDGAVPLYVRVAHAGKDRYISLGLRVLPKHWNGRRAEVRRSHPEADRLNGLLADRLADARRAVEDAALSGLTVTPDKLKEQVGEALFPPRAGGKETSQPCLIAYARQYIASAEAEGRVGTAYAYGSALNHLCKANAALRGASDLPFSAVDASFLRAFYERLVGPASSAGSGGLGLSLNYAAKCLGFARTVARRAAADGVPGAIEATAQFVAVRLKRERVEKPRLTLAQIEKMEAAALSGRAADSRDVFVLSFYAGGMRVSDAILLRWADVDRAGEPWQLRWRQKKTGESVTLPVVSGGRAVLDRWLERTGHEGTSPSPFVFGLLEEEDAEDPRRLRDRINSRAALIRKLLYKTTESLGLPRVGPHAARHSLADHLRRSGASVYDISRVLGHSSIQITERYLALFDVERAGAALVGAFGESEERS